MLFGLMIKHYQRNLTQLNTTFCPNLSICCLKDELWGMSKKGLTKLTDPIRETCVKVIGCFFVRQIGLLQLSCDGVIELYQVQCVQLHVLPEQLLPVTRFLPKFKFCQNLQCVMFCNMEVAVLLQMLLYNIMNDERQKIQNNSPA